MVAFSEENDPVDFGIIISNNDQEVRFVKMHLEALLEKYKISQRNTRVGIIAPTPLKSPALLKSFRRYASVKDIVDEIKRNDRRLPEKVLEINRFLKLALTLSLSELFAVENGGRDKSKKILLLFTNEKHDPIRFNEELRFLKQNGVHPVFLVLGTTKIHEILLNSTDMATVIRPGDLKPKEKITDVITEGKKDVEMYITFI